MLYQTVYALYMVPRSQLNIFQYVMKIQWLVKYFLRHQWKLILTKRHDYHLENLSQVIDLQANQYRHISQLVLFLYICIFTTVLSLQINGHLCLTVTLRPAQLILLYNLTLFNGHLSNAANGHLFDAWIVRSSSNNGHFGHLIKWHNVYDRSHDTVTFKIINNRRREIQLIELVI
jgi:hypothetical protein